MLHDYHVHVMIRKEHVAVTLAIDISPRISLTSCRSVQRHDTRNISIQSVTKVHTTAPCVSNTNTVICWRQAILNAMRACLLTMKGTGPFPPPTGDHPLLLPGPDIPRDFLRLRS